MRENTELCDAGSMRITLGENRKAMRRTAAGMAAAAPMPWKPRRMSIVIPSRKAVCVRLGGVKAVSMTYCLKIPVPVQTPFAKACQSRTPSCARRGPQDGRKTKVNIPMVVSELDHISCKEWTDGAQ